MTQPPHPQPAGPDFAGVLAAHRLLIKVGQAKACTCGWEDGFSADVESQHIAHVAERLNAELERWLWSAYTDSDFVAAGGTFDHATRFVSLGTLLNLLAAQAQP